MLGIPCQDACLEAMPCQDAMLGCHASQGLPRTWVRRVQVFLGLPRKAQEVLGSPRKFYFHKILQLALQLALLALLALLAGRRRSLTRAAAAGCLVALSLGVASQLYRQQALQIASQLANQLARNSLHFVSSHLDYAMVYYCHLFLLVGALSGPHASRFLGASQQSSRGSRATRLGLCLMELRG